MFLSRKIILFDAEKNRILKDSRKAIYELAEKGLKEGSQALFDGLVHILESHPDFSPQKLADLLAEAYRIYREGYEIRCKEMQRAEGRRLFNAELFEGKEIDWEKEERTNIPKFSAAELKEAYREWNKKLSNIVQELFSYNTPGWRMHRAQGKCRELAEQLIRLEEEDLRKISYEVRSRYNNIVQMFEKILSAIQNEGKKEAELLQDAAKDTERWEISVTELRQAFRKWSGFDQGSEAALDQKRGAMNGAAVVPIAEKKNDTPKGNQTSVRKAVKPANTTVLDKSIPLRNAMQEILDKLKKWVKSPPKGRELGKDPLDALFEKIKEYEKLGGERFSDNLRDWNSDLLDLMKTVVEEGLRDKIAMIFIFINDMENHVHRRSVENIIGETRRIELAEMVKKVRREALK